MTTTQPQAGSEMTVKDAMRRAFYLGQTYWQQADSEYVSQNKKADETMAKYETLVEETLAILARDYAPEALGAAKGELSDEQIVHIANETSATCTSCEWLFECEHLMTFARAILAKAKEQS